MPPAQASQLVRDGCGSNGTAPLTCSGRPSSIIARASALNEIACNEPTSADPAPGHCQQTCRLPPLSANAVVLNCSLEVRRIAGREPNLEIDSYSGPFGQMLTHLAVNAIAHALNGGGNGAIDIGLSLSADDIIRLLVVDDGCGGMAPEVKRQTPLLETIGRLSAVSGWCSTSPAAAQKQSARPKARPAKMGGPGFASDRQLGLTRSRESRLSLVLALLALSLAGQPE